MLALSYSLVRVVGAVAEAVQVDVSAPALLLHFLFGFVIVGQEDEQGHVHQHEAREHEELRGLFSEHLGLGHHDDDDLAEGDGEEPGGLHHGLLGDRGLAVGELPASHGEHDLADGDDDVLGDLPEHVDSVGRGEREEGG